MAEVHLIFLTTYNAGHVVSTAEMAKRLLNHHPNVGKSHFSVTILVAGSELMSPAIASYIKIITAAETGINFHELPEIEPPTDVDSAEDWLSSFIHSYKPHVKAAVAGLMSSFPAVALILDMFATTITEVADEYDIPCYIYYTSSASLLCLLLFLQVLHERISVDFEEMDGELEVPGISPLPLRALPPSILNKKLKSYTWLLNHGRRIMETKGIIVNTFAGLEPGPLNALAEPGFIPGKQTPTVYAVGPVLGLNNSNINNENRHECLNWLDGQPRESVVFLCFGSEGSFDVAQVTEIATALESSGHRFLWALRVRSTRDVDVNMDQVLPNGFVERTRDRGLVWKSWVPQVQILAHQAVGGFMTHCGWNSCLESLWFGVSMLGWPLYAEQHCNAFVMAKDMGVALELEVDWKKDNYVGKEELERGVRCLMEDCEEGNRVRERVKDMKMISRKVMEVGGSSFDYMEKLVKDLTTNCRSSSI